MAEARAAARARRWLAPEVVQASPMDCGPSALHALATGFGVKVSYARLREACQTDVDGTSIDALERVAKDLGLDAVQMIAPADHVGHPRAATLPAIAVVQLPGGSTHFVLVWRRVGRWLQVMDPGSGRRWVELERFRRTLYFHSLELPAELWRRFVGSAGNAGVLSDSLRALGHRHARARVAEALEDPGWRPIAALEAAARMARSLVASRALARGGEAERLIDALYARARGDDPQRNSAIPAVFWSARGVRREGGGVILNVRGVLLVRARARSAPSALAPGEPERRPPALVSALAEEPLRVGRELLRELRGADRKSAFGLAGLALSAAGLVLLQAL